MYQIRLKFEENSDIILTYNKKNVTILLQKYNILLTAVDILEDKI